MNFSGLFSLCLTLLITHCNTLAIRDTPFENVYDVDPGDFRDDIPKINLESPRFLFQGDIVQSLERNALKDPTSRWKFPIPYILADNLDLNAKGEILNSFEQYRLKSCVDFKPYDGEETYIIFQKLDGCWSSVGDLHSGQTVSIGERCDYKAIVEHELLHALGFYHEQSRTDRDDYVNIWWDEIIPGMEHNFVVYDDNYITDLNTPYDYESLMHYAPFSFNINDSFPTITAKIPAFDEIIGQRLDFSAIDLLRLNRMYNCSSTLTLLDQCSFEFINICGMIQGENEDVDWIHMKSNPGNEDHTVNGKCRDSGYFMYFDVQSGKIGQTALLESRILYPKRTEQCLQFFYKMTGSLKDKLVIWMKIDDGTGTVRKLVKIKTFQADGSHAWNIAHVTLHAKVKFRYLFQGIIGDTTNSAGGIFLDDITLTETRCPQAVWHIKNFSAILQNTGVNDTLKSPRFYNTEGYGYGLILHPHSRYENYMGLFFQLCSGENDGILEWPAGNRQAMVTVMDQDPDVKLRMSSSRSFTTNGSQVITDRNDTFFWDRPTLTGTYDSICDCYRSITWGWSAFISHKQLQRRNFLKNDDLIIFVEFNDLTSLINSEVPIHPPSSPERHRRAVDYAEYVQEPQNPLQDLCHPEYCLNGGVCIMTKGNASCRCGSTQTRLYFGERCERMQIHGSLFGIMIGGTAGVIALAVAVISMIAKTRINGKHPIGSLFDS